VVKLGNVANTELHRNEGKLHSKYSMKYDLKSSLNKLLSACQTRLYVRLHMISRLSPMQGLDVKSTLKHICFHTVNRQLRDFLVS